MLNNSTKGFKMTNKIETDREISREEMATMIGKKHIENVEQINCEFDSENLDGTRYASRLDDVVINNECYYLYMYYDMDVKIDWSVDDCDNIDWDSTDKSYKLETM
jgi:hypothetical protein